MQTLHTSRYALALLLTLGMGASLKAQAANQAGAASDQTQAASQAPVVLNAFTVDTSTDVGYVAVNSLAGGRNNTPLAITPTTVSALTGEFIDDLQLTNASDALKWTMNAIPQNFTPNVGSGNEFNSWANNLRGAGAGPQGGTPPTVNYFPLYAIKDFFNVDRFELNLGPNSILFGVGNLGGVSSSYTKKPVFNRDFTELDLVVNSYGGARATLDVNQLVSILHKDDLGVRVNLLADRDEDWRKEDEIKRWGVAVATTFKISDKATVRFDVEGYEVILPQYAENISDQYSQWNGQTASPTWGVAPTGPSNSYQSMAEWGGPSSFQLWIPSEGTLMNWGAGYRGTGLGDGPFYTTAILRPYAYALQNPGYWPAGTGTEILPALPSRGFTVGPTDGTNTLKYYTLTAYFDQEISSNCEFELSAYRFSDTEVSKNFESPTNVSVDINKQMPNGMPNPEFGQLYSDMFLDKQVQDHSANEFRGQLNYHFDVNVFNIPVKEWLSLSGGDVFHLLLTREYNGSFANYPDPWNSNNWTEDMIWAREYWNQPNLAINLPNTFGGHAIVYQALPFNWFDHDLSESTAYFGGVSQTRLWDDRLNITLGARHDDYNSVLLQSVRPPYGLPYPQGYTFETDVGNTYSAGFVARSPSRSRSSTTIPRISRPSAAARPPAYSASRSDRPQARRTRPACASPPTTAGTTSRPTTTRTSPTGASATTASASRASGTTISRRAEPRRTSGRPETSRARRRTSRPSSTMRTRRTSRTPVTRFPPSPIPRRTGSSRRATPFRSPSRTMICRAAAPTSRPT